jgi:phenylacetate-CoA ligase
MKPRYRHRPKYLHADLLKPEYCAWIQFLKQSEKWSAAKIEEYQMKEIQRVVRYAYENTRGYRALYDSMGISPKSITTMHDFRRVPFVSKETIKQDLESFSTKVPGRQYVTTGGSTGVPFGFYRNRVAFAKELASKAYQYRRVGWKEGDRQIVLRGLVIPSRNHIKYYARFNELRCSSYHLVPECMELYRERAFEFRPQWIKCYPSAGYLFAKYLKETGKPFPRIKGLLCTSEILYPHQMELLSQVFKTRVFSHYGHYEMAVLAGFCEWKDSYHVLPQYGYAELVDSHGDLVTQPGKTGEIVGTSFIQEATPFIRYRTGDLAVLEGWGCSSCGRPYQVWKRIEGRWTQEFIVTGTNRYISITAMNMHDDIFDHIKQFQFYQEEKGRVAFRFVPGEGCTDRTIAHMKRRLMIKLGNDVNLEMEPVSEIFLTRRGKHRFIVQKLKLEIQNEIKR